MTHDIDEKRDPLGITVRCTCGWHHRESRRQNAWARAAKIRAAIDLHLRNIEAIREGAKP